MNFLPKILIVDDSPEMLSLMVTILGATGYVLLQAESGAECLRQVAEEKPDLVILDINLPDINGIDVCRTIKADPHSAGVYVLFMTGMQFTSEDKASGYQAGAEGFLFKPFTREELLSRVNSLLKLLNAERSARQNEEFLNSLLSNIPDSVFMTDGQGHFTYKSLNFNTFFDLQPEEAAAIHTVCQLFKKQSADYQEVLEKREIRNREVDFLPPGGHLKKLLVNVKAVEIDDSRILFTCRDITERMAAREQLKEYSKTLEKEVALRVRELNEKTKKLEDSQRALTYLLEDVNEARIDLENANRNLSILNKELESFSYSVSHDLRAPIRAIDGFSRILLEDYGKVLDQEGNRLLGVIIKSASAMQQLIDDLLAFSRLGQRQPNRYRFDAGLLVAEVVDELKRAAGNRRIEWKIGQLPEIYADRSLLKQVFTNLLGNAVKFTGEQEVAVIEVGGRQNSQETEIYVKDNGVGFEMQYAPKIFEVFQRLHDHSQFEGTGIGLAIVRKIIDKHNGKIIPDSKVGEGSVFTITLPDPHGL